MDLHIRLDQERGAYTEKDNVSGHIFLRNKSPVNISTVTVKLSGIATSRLSSGKYIESHQVRLARFNSDSRLLTLLICSYSKEFKMFSHLIRCRICPFLKA